VSAVITQIIAGAAVSWPAVFFGYWLNRKRTREKIDQVTRDQTAALTGSLVDVTTAQTRVLKKAIGIDPGPAPDPAARADPDRLA
jgi:hypothetical protein